MKINTIANSPYYKTESETPAGKASDAYKAATYRKTSKSDSVEISSEAYEAYTDNEELRATSGKDSLGITRGGKKNSFVIHFSDSALVSRAITRGFITVNGTKIELTDDTKKQLMQVDKQAQADRDQAFGEYYMQHEAAVAEQQGEVYKKMAEDMSKALEIAARLSKGGKVSPAEEKRLLEFSPQLYTMSKNAAMLAKQDGKRSVEAAREPEVEEEETQKTESVDWSPVEIKSYETRLTVSLSDTVQIEDISEGLVET